MDQATFSTLRKYFDMVHSITMRAIDVTDRDLDFRPKPDMRTPRELLFHVYSQEKILAESTAFISYSHKDRAFGAQAKGVLAEVGIESFLAHDDLHVSDEWLARIIEELKRCDIFTPLLSADFLPSKWAPQEVGFIISRPDVAIAPLSLDGTTPFGFISPLRRPTGPERNTFKVT